MRGIVGGYWTIEREVDERHSQDQEAYRFVGADIPQTFISKTYYL